MQRALKEYRVRSIRGEPDGRAWNRAGSLTDFAFPWLDRAAPATVFRALWSAERFFFRFDADDDDLVLGESGDAVARVLRSDRVELFFACDAAIERYYCAEMDPRGGVYDYAARFYRKFDADWKWPGLAVEARLRAGGYTVEGSIPMAAFHELGIDGVQEGRLRAGVYRAEFSHAPGGAITQDWISWVDPATSKADFHVPASFGVFSLES